MATLQRDSVPTNLNQSNVQPVYDIYASVQGRSLGSIASRIGKIIGELQREPKPGDRIQMLGQIQSMHDSFWALGIGLAFAAVFVYLLMVVSYQNFADPFVVILALPATFCGIVTMLFITGTTINVPSLMGAIMAVGVASANSILLGTFARIQQLKGRSAFRAALDAGRTRIRPVLMTATAMIAGMIPMAIGGPGEEQNAALARAVICGLRFATPTTLLIVPYLFATLRMRNDGARAFGVFEDLPDERSSSSRSERYGRPGRPRDTEPAQAAPAGAPPPGRASADTRRVGAAGPRPVVGELAALLAATTGIGGGRAGGRFRPRRSRRNG